MPSSKLKPFKRARLGQHQGAYYIRLTAYDRPGVMAAITTRMAEREVSLESIVQRSPRGAPGALATVVIITHETTEAAIRTALDLIEADGKRRRAAADDPHRTAIMPTARFGRQSARGTSVMAKDNGKPHGLERVLVLEVARVTEAAAIAAARLRGRGNEKAADKAAVDAMRRASSPRQRQGHRRHRRG